MSNHLYSELKNSSQCDVKSRIKLDSLLATLLHFNVQEEFRGICAEALLRMEKVLTQDDVPADEQMKRLMDMYKFFKKGDSDA